MITLQLAAQYEKVAPHNPWPSLQQWPLYHQLRTAQALQEPDAHVVLNSYDTGTGKTVASLLHLFKLDGERASVLFVAPTNALLHQHVEDMRNFVASQGLDYEVIAVTAATTRALGRRIEDNLGQGGVRRGEVLSRLIRNYREFLPDDQQRRGVVLVVNPDIFYYALTWRYGTHDERNLFEQFLTAFQYIIIDEFHYYNQKQLAFFLFFFAISQELGYFEQGRRICLLSATPDETVTSYFNNLFGDRWRHVSSENEPPESEAYQKVPTLAPLTLTVVAEALLPWVKANSNQLRQWVRQDGQDGALISDALWRINQVYGLLRSHFDEGVMGRITGPEPQEERLRVTGLSLILATPTVDIGYNFKKKKKRRQNIDFLIYEARYGDDFLQRLGRAGRVLGKAVCDQPSQAIALLSDSAAEKLKPFDGQKLTRRQLRQILAEHPDAFPHKHHLRGYIESWAITELFYPIYRSYKLVSEDDHQRLDALFEQLQALFNARHKTKKSLNCYFRKYYDRERWLRQVKKSGEIPFNLETAKHASDFLRYIGAAEVDPASLVPHLDHENILGTAFRKQVLHDFVAAQKQLTDSLFHFRDSFQGPTALVYDPKRLLSSQPVNGYDLFHLVENYQMHWFRDLAEYLQFAGPLDLNGEIDLKQAHYVQLLAFRDPRLRLEFYYEADCSEEEFERWYECRPVALRDVKLWARESGGDSVVLYEEAVTALQDRWMTVLLIPEELVGHAVNAMRHSPIYGRQFLVDFADGWRKEYLCFTGHGAWFAEAELRVAFKIRERMKSEAIIL